MNFATLTKSSLDAIPLEMRPTRFVGTLDMRISKPGYKGGTWFAGQLRTDTGQLIECSGEIGLNVDGERVAVSGKWENGRYGEQLKVDSVRIDDPSKAEELFIRSGALKGVGEKKAQAIIDHFSGQQGSLFDHMSEDELLKVKGIGPVNVKWVMESWGELKDTAVAASFGMSIGLTLDQSKKAYKLWEDDMRQHIEQRPYDLTLVGLSFKAVDKIALNLEHPKDAPDRIEAATRHVLQEAMRKGHTCLPTKEQRPYNISVWGNVASLIGDDVSRGQWVQAILDQSDREGDKRTIDIITEEVMTGDEEHPISKVTYLADAELHRMEREIAADLARLMACPVKPLPITDPIIDSLSDPLALAEQQREAVKLAAVSPVMILTGGPGTGKTTVLKCILDMFANAKLLFPKTTTRNLSRMRCGAPTGKAAVRMEEATNYHAMTIHRMLEWQGEFQVRRGQEMEANVVVIDETSMVDTRLMWSLLQAISEGTRVILVGDADQLPPVGPGQAFRTILESGFVPTVQLTQVHRQAAGSGIVNIAHDLNDGKPVKLEGWPDVAWRDMGDDEEQMVIDVVNLISLELPEMGIKPEDVTVLAPYNRHVNALNWRLQARLNQNMQFAREFTKWLKLAEGDRVRHTKNNYELNVFNGETGTVLHVMSERQEERWKENSDTWKEDPPLVVVEYPGKVVRYTRKFVNELVLCYAQTIHSSQGSEYPWVVMLAPMVWRGFLVRELFYTAITRAKKGLVMVGNRDIWPALRRGDARAHRYERLSTYLGGKTLTTGGTHNG